MRCAALVLLAAFSANAGEPDWPAKLTPKAPGNFAPLRPFKANYSFGWMAVTAGRVEVEFTRTGETSQLKVQGGSAGAARALWRMDAEAVSTVLNATLLPTKLVQVERYSDEKRTTTVIFGPEGVERTRVREPKDKDSGKTKRFKFAPVHDLHSALLFIRSQNLRKGDIVRLATYPESDGYLAEIEVVGREKISVAGKQWPAIKLALRLKRISKRLELESHKKFKSASAWLSDDADRLLLKIDADVMVGKVWMDLQQIDFTTPQR
ncbi:MAG: DUF3108 domain-containing protein [Chthoniobacteraceae bacterium]